MTDLSLDRDLRDLFARGPATAPATTVEHALARTATLAQRRPRIGWLDRRAWPPRPRSASDPMMQRAARLLAVAVLLAALGAAIAVGARLLDRPPTLTVQEAASIEGLVGPQALLWPDGRVLILTERGTAFLFDPTTGAVDRQAFSFDAPDYGDPAPSIHVLPDGRIMLIQRGSGEAAPAAVGFFDAATGEARPVGELPQPWFGMATLVLRDGRVLTSGGVLFPNGDLPCGTTVCEGTATPEPTPDEATAVGAKDRISLFDPTTGTTAEVGRLRTGRFQHDTVELADGRILIVGGGTYGDPPASEAVEVEVFDLTTGIATGVGSIAPRYWPVPFPSVQLADGRVLIPGEQVLELPCGTPLSSNGQPALPDRHAIYRQRSYVFDPASNSVGEGPLLPHFYGGANLIPLVDGGALAFGAYPVAPEGCGSDAGAYTKPWLGVVDIDRNTVFESFNPLSGLATLDLDVTRQYEAGIQLPDGRLVLVGRDNESEPTRIDLVTVGR